MRKDTTLIEAGRPPVGSGVPVNPVIQKSSTFLFDTLEEYEEAGSSKWTSLRYGRHGTSTVLAFQEAMAEVDGGFRAIALPSGVAAISTTLLALARPGAHILVCDNVFGPTRNFCEKHLRPIGVEVTYFPPSAGVDIEGLFRANTAAVYCESPGTATFEMQDIPAIAEVAHRSGAVVIHDGTWATPYFFSPFEHGVDVSIHSATKYIGGHSDMMMGVVICNEPAWHRVRPVVADIGFAVSSDDAYLALRGLRTLALRMERHGASALRIARYLAGHERTAAVLYPAMPSSRGHDIWRRDFTGASGLLGVRLRARRSDIRRLVDNLRLFGIGSSWGGYESLVTMPTPVRTLEHKEEDTVLLRLHVGLEDPDDLLEDLQRNLERLPG